MTLTPELKAQGWRDIGEIESAEDNALCEVASMRSEQFVEQRHLWDALGIKRNMPETGVWFFRILAPVITWRPITDISDDNVIPADMTIEIKRIGDIDYYRIKET